MGGRKGPKAHSRCIPTARRREGAAPRGVLQCSGPARRVPIGSDTPRSALPRAPGQAPVENERRVNAAHPAGLQLCLQTSSHSNASTGGVFSISPQNIAVSDGWANLSVYLPWRYTAKLLIFVEITSSSVGRIPLKSRAFLEIENCCKGPLEATSKFVVLIKTSYAGRWKHLLDLPSFETTSFTEWFCAPLYVYLYVFMASLLISRQTVQRSLLFLMLHLSSPQS